MSIRESDRFLGVELRHLAALQAVAQEGTFGRAAARLGYTQSAVSQQIAALERAVGCRLVERPGGPRAVSLTQAGELLLRHAEAIVARLRAAEADLAALADGAAGTLRVGTFQSAGARILPELMRRYVAQWPEVQVRLTEDNVDTDLLGAVERGELDLAFSTLPVPDRPVDARELVEDPWVLLVHAGSPLADHEGPLPLRELDGLPLISFSGCRTVHAMEESLRMRGIRLNVIFRSDHNDTVQALVATGFGAALVPSLVVDPGGDNVAVVQLGGRLAPRRVAIAWHRDRYLTPAAQAFVATAQEVCTDLAPLRPGTPSAAAP
jgi:DNA-binding transcriptional LysR family regulator